MFVSLNQNYVMAYTDETCIYDNFFRRLFQNKGMRAVCGAEGFIRTQVPQVIRMSIERKFIHGGLWRNMRIEWEAVILRGLQDTAGVIAERQDMRMLGKRTQFGGVGSQQQVCQQTVDA